MAVEANPRDARAVKRVVKSILKTSWEDEGGSEGTKRTALRAFFFLSHNRAKEIASRMGSKHVRERSNKGYEPSAEMLFGSFEQTGANASRSREELGSGGEGGEQNARRWDRRFQRAPFRLGRESARIPGVGREGGGERRA